MAFSYITLVSPYILLTVQDSVSLSMDNSAEPSFVFGKLYQTSSGSSLVIGTNYCLDGTGIKSLIIENGAYYLALESNIRFTETAPTPPSIASPSPSMPALR